VHLRNIISSTIKVKGSILDMLIYTLSGLLWQPDYMPHVDVGLPQINLDAPRILAHCFLYELDRYIVSTFGSDYVRFMDDIDIGVASVQEAKEVLKCVDLVLHTRQIRLNSGKTRILTNSEAVRHFCVRENRLLDILGQRVDAYAKAGRSLGPQRRRVAWLLHRWGREKRFDQVSGEKVLKRLLSMASKLDADVDEQLVIECVHERPSCREAIFRLLTRRPFEAASRRIVTNFMTSGMICDDITLLHIAYCVVEAPANDASSARKSAREVSKMIGGNSFFRDLC
jgi:hypothetical protein